MKTVDKLKLSLAGLVLSLSGCVSSPSPPVRLVVLDAEPTRLESYIAPLKQRNSFEERLRKMSEAASAEVDRKIKLHWESHERNKLYTSSDCKDAEGNVVVSFDAVAAPVIEGLNGVRVIPRSDWYGLPLRGMMHPEDGTVCVTEGYKQGTLFHEFFHNFHKSAEKRAPGFTLRWKAVNPLPPGVLTRSEMTTKDGKLFLDSYWNDVGSVGPKEGPRYGILDPYGAKGAEKGDVDEDIAMYGNALGYIQSPEEVLHDLHRQVRRFLTQETTREKAEQECKELLEIALHLEPLYFCDPDDAAYRAHIDLLNEHGAFKPEQYELLVTRLSSLHPYWKDENVLETLINEVSAETVAAGQTK